MPQPSVVLHIGLHKTATRYLQRAVFRQLDPARFLVNPEPLFHDLRQAARHPGDESWARAAAAAARTARDQAGGRTLVLSDPSISGDMYSSHADYRENLELVHELFPDARVIYFVRRQSDWLQSAYRQSLVKGRSAPIEQFLNFRDGAFRPRPGKRVNGVRVVDALTLRFLDIYRAYAERFGPERVYLFRQEDLRRRPDAIAHRMSEALGIERLPPEPDRVSGNKSFSALAIRLFFSGVQHTPAADSADAPQHSASGRWPRLVSAGRKFRTLFIRHVFDRLIYRDWDLLEAHGMRGKLDEHYDDEYRVLTAVAQSILDSGPGESACRVAAAGPGAVDSPRSTTGSGQA